MQRIISKDFGASKLGDLINRWEVVLEGGKSATFEVCKALVSDDKEEFADQFDAFIHARQERLKTYRESADCDKEKYAAEGNVFIEGLCLLRIAEFRDISIKDEYPLIPQIALRLKNVSFPPEDSWQTL